MAEKTTPTDQPPPGDRTPRAAALYAVTVLRNAGHTAFFAGGCVRDELLGLIPKDYDVATDAIPQRVESLFRSADLVGRSFGVVIVRLGRQEGFDERVHVEVATFRKEAGYSDNRRPDEVEFTDASTDAHRRDFTVNALFLDPTQSQGTPTTVANATPLHIIDHVKGLPDLRARIIRAVGTPADRLAEDHLRALRAVRLAARLGFDIDPTTAEAIREHASSLQGVSVERIGDEIRRIFNHPSLPARAHAAALLDDLNLTKAILPEAIDRNTPNAGSLLTNLPDTASPAAALTAWALDHLPETSPPRLARTLRNRLALSNDETRAIEQAAEGRLILADDWPSQPIARQRRTAATPWFADALALIASEDPDVGSRIARHRDHLAATPPGLAPPPLLDGDTLIAQGHQPGPHFGPILEAVYDAQLEGRLLTQDDAIRYAIQIYSEHASGEAPA